MRSKEEKKGQRIPKAKWEGDKKLDNQEDEDKEKNKGNDREAKGKRRKKGDRMYHPLEDEFNQEWVDKKLLQKKQGKAKVKI